MVDQPELLLTFVELADTLVDDFDLVDFLHRLTIHCVSLLDVSDAGVMLEAADGSLRYVASSSEQMRLVELLELQHEEGPCFDAHRSRELEVSASADESDRRWPRFGPHARKAGFESLAGVPMRLRRNVVGTLNLFSTAVGGLSDEDQPAAQAIADVATIGILQERAIRDRQMLATQLDTALRSRVAIEQAKGVVAERTGLTIDASFTLLRDFARSHNQKLTETAHAVVNGTLRLDAQLARRASSPDDAAGDGAR